MDEVKASPFKFKEFIVQEFQIKRAPNEPGEVKIKIEPSGYLDKVERSFLLHLDVGLKDESESFDISMSALGRFDFADLENAEPNSPFFRQNAPAIVFPYIRAYISAVSALSGLGSINIPTMNLANLQEELKNNITTSDDIDEDEAE